LSELGIRVNSDGPKRTLLESLALPGADVSAMADAVPQLSQMGAAILTQVTRDALYAHYIERQRKDVEALKKDESCEIPEGFVYASLDGLSNELRSKLERVQPRTLAQAGRINGMTPAALTLILAHLRKAERRRA
jgi:tRNA uridine 5-carboxymethylaminomethyl modification enzyme